MTISSRTPEGRPNRCPVCRRRLRISPSWPTADAPCPRCGSLVWFPTRRFTASPGQRESSAQLPEPAIQFTIGDFRAQFKQIRELGMSDVLHRLPVVQESTAVDEDPEFAVRRVQGIIDAMTQRERAEPEIIDTSRRRRIAAGAGVEPQEVDRFLEQFGQVRTVMEQMARMSLWQRLKMMWRGMP